MKKRHDEKGLRRFCGGIEQSSILRQK